jgi:hypothetical protein
MAFEMKDNSGSIWANDRKTDENHPDRAGSALIDGREFWINGWLRKTSMGKPYLSLSFKPKDAEKSAGGGSPKRDDSEIPF